MKATHVSGLPDRAGGKKRNVLRVCMAADIGGGRRIGEHSTFRGLPGPLRVDTFGQQAARLAGKLDKARRLILKTRQC